MNTNFTFQAQGFDFITGTVWAHKDSITFMGCTTIDKRSYLCSIEKEKGKRRKTTVSVKRYDEEKHDFVGAKVYSYDVIRRLQEATIAKYEIFMKLNKPF